MILPLRVLGRWSRISIWRGRNGRPERRAGVGPQLAHQGSSVGSRPGFERDERLDDVAGDLVGDADDAGLGDGRVLEQRALDLERADEVAGAS